MISPAIETLLGGKVFTQAGAVVSGKINRRILWSNAARRPFSVVHAMLGFLFFFFLQEKSCASLVVQSNGFNPLLQESAVVLNLRPAGKTVTKALKKFNLAQRDKQIDRAWIQSRF